MKDLEHQEQVAVVEWADYQRWNGKRIGDYLAAIPNGGHRHPAVAGKLKAEGVRRGFPDLILAIPITPYHGLFIEMKARGGRPSVEQKCWISLLREQGYQAVVAVGADQAIAEIQHYLTGGGRVYVNGSH